MTRSMTRREDWVALGVLTREIVALKGRVGEGLYGIGVRLARVQDEALWQARHAGFDEYLAEGVGFSRTTAYRLMRIARHFNAAIAERYGVEKLDAALRYLQATPEDERPGDLVAAEIRVRDEHGRFEAVGFHEASAKQINEAAALLHDVRRHARVPKGFRSRVRKLAAGLPKAPRGTAHGDRVRVSRGKDGRVALTFQAIPADQIEAFITALREHVNETEA